MNAMNDWVLREGMDVLAADGEKVGEVKDAMGESFSVKEGWFFPKEHIIPSSVITSVDDSAVHLGVSKDQALAEDWTIATTATGASWDTSPPADQSGTGGIYDGTTASGRTPDTLGSAFDRPTADDQATADDRTIGDASGVYSDAAAPGDRADLNASDTDTMNPDTTAATGGVTNPLDRYAATEDTDTIRVPLSEEELVATRKDVDRGTVRVQREVVSEEQSLDVPVTEEEVHVSRRVVDGDETPGEDAFQEGTIEIPVRGEEVEVEKRRRVTGELDIEKRAATRSEHVTDTVRREEARVIDENGVAIDDTAATSTGSTRAPRKKK